MSLGLPETPAQKYVVSILSEFQSLIGSLVKCDSAKTPDGRCSNCISSNLLCPHTIPAKKRGPKGKHTKLHNLKSIDLDGIPESSHSPSGGSETGIGCRSPEAQTLRLDEGGFQDPVLANHLQKLCLDVSDSKFFGLTSAHLLLRHGHLAKKDCFMNKFVTQTYFKRDQFWNTPHWEKSLSSIVCLPFAFPEHDLMSCLVSLYFSKVNLIYPILHQPSFEDAILDGNHSIDPQLASILLLVCALGAKYANDPRVFLEAEEGKELSSGWRWFEQVQAYRESSSPFSSSLYELQYHCLAVLYLQGTSQPSPTWTLVGTGIRLAVEIGLHRRLPDNHQKTGEYELKQRAFWVLVCMDKILCSWLGRPCVIRDEDIDAEYPTECDDEYWQNDGSQAVFRQPSHQPSKLSFFVHYLKLCEIISFAMVTIYSAKRPKLAIGLLPEDWDTRLEKQLNMAMKKWLDSIPEHLRWKPRPDDDIFLSQSVFLYAGYYFTEIQLQRPFFQHNSLQTISLGAAKSAIEVVSCLVQKQQVVYHPEIIFSCFTSITVLLTDMWKSKRNQPEFDGSQALAHARKAIQTLHAFESRYLLAGRLCDLLDDFCFGLDISAESSSASLSSKHHSGARSSIALTVNCSSLTTRPITNPEYLTVSSLPPHTYRDTSPSELSGLYVKHFPSSPATERDSSMDPNSRWSVGRVVGSENVIEGNCEEYLNVSSSLHATMDVDFWQIPSDTQEDSFI
ncbi:hypothetical protein E1B28_002461 [Marasmius oreades]|uniref:Xylanolytic transcriptional activator regulatory domain-containing protein n=1 Tax=Marasmius oreades TaxID=181124 RepID=A0A9P7ULF3_9AGAR|nr:uncharacterized protein E1B28_002461 [Marasmius oreades]KAG7086508.1 hypothetical protein E1B28_002461 [Marasmius oreades]